MDFLCVWIKQSMHTPCDGAKMKIWRSDLETLRKVKESVAWKEIRE